MAPPPAATRRLWRAVQLLFGVAVAAFVAWALVEQWGAVRAVAGGIRPRWGFILMSCAVVLGAYLLQIALWRALLAAWGPGLPYGEAARIWFISNLGRYVPGKVWQIGSMAVMAERRGSSSVGAVAAALIATIVTTLAGFGVTAVSGIGVLRLPPAALAVLGALALGTLLLPLALPMLVEAARRITRRDITIPRLPARTLWIALAAASLAWFLYGFAFQLLTIGLLGEAPGGLPFHVAVFTGSYLLGFLALFAPGGIGVRESAMGLILGQAGYDAGSAIVLVVASRVWLTVLEVGPALLFLALDAARRRSPPAPPRE